MTQATNKFHKRKGFPIRPTQSPADKILPILKDFAREDFINPFAELARIKLFAAQLIKDINNEKE